MFPTVDDVAISPVPAAWAERPSEPDAPSDAERIRDALAAIYPELRRIARTLLKRERTFHTLQPTALTNEALARLLEREAAGCDPRELVFHGIREMRTILIDSGRRYRTRILYIEPDNGQEAAIDAKIEELVHLQSCLDRLEAVAPRARQVVDLRYFVGLTIEEAAEFLDVCERTVRNDWEFARGWLAEQWRSVDERDVDGASPK